MASELHELSYWEKVYTNEKDNYKELNIELEEWFEENCDKIINWINNNFKENKNISILDIGSGNGLFLHKLYKKGFGNLYGFDFSKTAIDLARSFFEDNNMNNIYLQIIYLFEKKKKKKNEKNCYLSLGAKLAQRIYACL
ncbi:Predicted AdoMet-dependent methyltransferase/Methyltransferase domain containing protein, putative [Plasmodium berghei]|uniref:Predicted AdoMet-dependent methyltransferase/Methyltransferase domain containing protein, putative n=1 Tax=Plasmodium berghei TaxID=5821 RepID=A0A1D3PZF4_PLABE|nr:Predicted AdoMet-dependent methyltransferase/Methyltransferase domain containing protein, putative [Plasmodium berghei]